MRMSETEKTLWGGITNNPVFVLVLGMCPTLAMSNNLKDAFWLGISTTFVLIFSNLIISALRKLIPDKVRIPCYIIIIATLVTIVDLFLQKFVPGVYKTIGTFIALIVVNCIILARAEAYASSNKPHMAVLDGVSMGLGFFLAICLLAFIREFLARGTLYGVKVLPAAYPGIGFFGNIAGGFVTLALLMGIFNQVYNTVLDRSRIRSIKLKQNGQQNTEEVSV